MTGSRPDRATYYNGPVRHGISRRCALSLENGCSLPGWTRGLAAVTNYNCVARRSRSWFGTVWSVAASCSRTRCHQLLRARQAQRVEHQTRKRARFSTGLPSIQAGDKALCRLPGVGQTERDERKRESLTPVLTRFFFCFEYSTQTVWNVCRCSVR
jgi:hypothetical protein